MAEGTLSRWDAVGLRRRLASCLAALVAAVAVIAMATPGEAHAFAWKDICSITVSNQTGTLSGFKPFGPILPEIPPNPADEASWDLLGALKFIGNGFPMNKTVSFNTIGIPITWGCSIHPDFQRGKDIFKCDVAAPSSGRNTFQCGGAPAGVDWKMTKDNDDVAGYVIAKPAPAQASRLQGRSSGASPPRTAPKRVPALLRRRDLPGRGWRPATKIAQFGWLGYLVATDPLPGSCQDSDKRSEPQAKRGGSSAFARRSSIIGYEHGVYAGTRQSRRRLRAAVSTHSIGCLARLLSSKEFHTQATIRRYSLSGLKGVTLWRVVVRTRAGGRVTRTDYVDIAGLLHRRSNGLVLFAKSRKPVRGAVERSVVRTVVGRLP
jgi:hypothetical protein